MTRLKMSSGDIHLDIEIDPTALTGTPAVEVNTNYPPAEWISSRELGIEPRNRTKHADTLKKIHLSGDENVHLEIEGPEETIEATGTLRENYPGSTAYTFRWKELRRRAPPGFNGTTTLHIKFPSTTSATPTIFDYRGTHYAW